MKLAVIWTFINWGLRMLNCLLGQKKARILCIDDVKGKFTLRSVSELRSAKKIIVIDNEIFHPLEMLTKHGFKVEQRLDLSSFDELDHASIVLCDIHGVGLNLGGKDGLFLLREIKKRLPFIYLISYSSQTFKAENNIYFELCDKVAKKDGDTEEWVQLLDTAVLAVSDPIEVWKKLRKYLLDSGMRISEVSKLESDFSKALEAGKDTIQLGDTKSFAASESVKEIATGVITNLLSAAAQKAVGG